MAKEDAYIEYIYNIIDKHKIQTANAAYKFHESDQNRPKPSVKLTQFKSYYKLANEKHTEAMRAKELEKQAAISESLKDEIQAQILTEIEIDLILSKIVTGDIKVEEYIKGEPVIRDVYPSDIIAAADKLYKRKGSYAPAKVAQTDPEGNAMAHLSIIAPVGVKLEFPSNTDGSDT